MKNRLRNTYGIILLGYLLLIGLIGINAQEIFYPLGILRLGLGLIYILFIPGYLLQSALLPGNHELDKVEKTAFSFALSGVIVPPIFLILNWLPWGIRLWPVVISLSSFIFICMIISYFRQSRLTAEQNQVSKERFSLRNWWNEQHRSTRKIYTTLSIVLIIAFLTGFSILISPKPADYFTEFYMVGPEGLAENFPREATLGQSITVTLGITNHERTTMSYRIEVWQVDPLDNTHHHLVTSSTSITLAVGQTHQWDQSWQPAWSGQDKKFEFKLFIPGKSDPYRQLLLWMNINP